MFLDYAAQTVLTVYTDKLAGCLGAADGKDAYTSCRAASTFSQNPPDIPLSLRRMLRDEAVSSDLLVFSGRVVVKVLLGEACSRASLRELSRSRMRK